MSHSNHFWLRIVVALLTFSATAWSETPPYVQSDTGDAAGVRMVANRHFDACAKKDLEGMATLWSAKSPSLESRKKTLTTLFAGVGPIELASLTVRDVSIEGEKARIRVTAEMRGVDAKTGKEAAGLGTVNRSLHLVKEDGIWKIWNDLSSEEELANALADAKTDQERGRLLTAEKYLVDIELRKALLELGIRQRSQSKFMEALATDSLARDIAEQIRDKAGVVIATNFIGIVQGQMGDFAAALRTFQKALELDEEIGSKIQTEAAFNNIGILYRQQGNYGSAMQYYQKAIAIAETLEDKSSMARTLNNLGTVYLKQGNYRQAMECLEKSLALKQALGDEADIPSGLFNIGDVYYETAEYSKAADYYERAVALYEKTGDKQGLASALKALGTIRFVRQDYTAAADYYQKSLDLHESIKSRFGIADSLDKLAFVSLKQRDFRKALELAGRVGSIAREEGLREQLWSALTTTGSAYQAMGRTEQARSAFNEAIDDIEAIRADVAGGASGQSDFFQNRLSPYQSMVELLIGQHEFAAALAYAERSKARTLLDVLSSGRINVTKAMTAGQRAEERALNVRLVSLNTQISREASRADRNSERLAALKSDLQKARLERESFQDKLYADHPELKVNRGQPEPLKMDDLSQLLPDSNSALLEYLVTDDRTFLFVVSGNQVGRTGASVAGKPAAASAESGQSPALAVFTIDATKKDLTEKTESFRGQLASRDLRFQKSARAMYDILLGPAAGLLAGKGQLIIVPDGPLWQLPFHTLQPRPNHYLLEDAAISYAPSLTVLREMVKLQRKRHPQSSVAGETLLAIGNPALGKQTQERLKAASRDEALEPLPEAEREVKAISQLYGADRSQVFIGAAAREDKFKTQAANFNVLHLATHGVLDNTSPMYSYLVLSQTEGTASEDGMLEAWEMMDLDLKADLVVLSACETARGRVTAGEGVIGMSWALFVAGCPTAVVSQWKVDSASTTQLMVDFHRQLQNRARSRTGHVNVAESLRDAALKLLHSSEYNQPFYWAGFVVIGAGS